MTRIVLAVDGGNTKTTAVVATAARAIVGRGSAGCADVYGAATAEAAVSEIVKAARDALGEARAAACELAHAVFSLAGADWPEDHAYLRAQLDERLALGGRLTVLNDAIGALWLADAGGFGVAVIVGTGAAIGARNAAGVAYHLGWWPERMGARAIGLDAWRVVYRAGLGIGAATSLAPRALDAFAVRSHVELLHAVTRRGGIGLTALDRLAPIVLDEAAAGDAASRQIVASHAERLAEIAVHCAGSVGIGGASHPLILGGSVLSHPEAALLTDAVIGALPAADVRQPSVEPVFGALGLALSAAGP